MLKYYLKIRNWLEREEGQDLIEYALLVVFIAVIVAVVLPGVGAAIASVFTGIAGWITSGMPS